MTEASITMLNNPSIANREPRDDTSESDEAELAAFRRPLLDWDCFIEPCESVFNDKAWMP